MPMYDWPEVWAENDNQWAKMRDALRAEGLDAPEKLNREIGYTDSWTRPDLVLGQACGLPFVKELLGKVSLIGAVKMDLEGCAPGQYNSHIIVHQNSDLTMDDLAGRKYAYNTACSQSGLACLVKMGLTGGDALESGGQQTKPTPAPVWIAAKGADVETYRSALDVVKVSDDEYLSLL